MLKRLTLVEVLGKKSAGNLKAEKILLRRFQFEELDKATQNFSKDCLLGYGGFGNVYKGTFDVEGTLAIKVAHSDSYPVEEFRNGKLQSTCPFPWPSNQAACISS